MNKYPFLENNIHAIEQFSVSYPDVPSAFDQDPIGAMAYLQLLGFKCAACGQTVTGPNIRFCNYDPKTLCISCQYKPELNFNHKPYGRLHPLSSV